MKRITILIVLITIGLSLKAQDLTQYNDFFINKIPEFKKWLIHTNIADVISFDTIKVRENKVNISLKVYDRTQSKLCDNANYFALNDTIEKTQGTNISEIIFEKISFLMDLKKDEIEINIDSKDAFIDIWYEENELIVDIVTKMGEIADGHRIAIGDIKGINKTGSATVNETITTIQTKLITELKKEYEEYEATFEHYEFDVISRLNNELIIEINNVVKLVIPDESYFEHINLKFKFTPNEDEVNIDYVIRAKYGAGIIWAPKNSDYYDMTPKYQDDLEKFSTKLKNQIDNILKN